MPHAILKRLRMPVFSGVILILFAASGLLLSLATAYRTHTTKNIQDIQSQFTSIAVSNHGRLLATSGYDQAMSTDGMIRSRENNLLQAYLSLYHLANTSENAVPDCREYLRAVAKNAWPVLSRCMNPDSHSDDTPYNASVVLAATCTDASFLTAGKLLQKYGMNGILYDDSGIAHDALHYEVTFSIDEEILLHQEYSGRNTITFVSNMCTSDGNIPFERGRRYIINGQYRDIPIVSNPQFYEALEKGISPSVPSTMFLPDGKPHLKPRTSFLLWKLVNPGESIEGIYPYPALKKIIYHGQTYAVEMYHDNFFYDFMVPLETDLDTFWAENPLWADPVTQYYPKNIRSLYVLTTDNTSSLLLFNQKKAWIAQGRDFTTEELAGRSAACLISESLATYNNLSVGDKLDLSLWDMRFNIDLWGMPLDYNGAHLDGDFRGDIAPTIVGIFSAPKEPFGKSAHSLSGNTVILPAKAVPIASQAAPLPASLEDLFSYPVQWDEDGNLIHNENEPFENIGTYRLLTFMPSVPIPDLFTAIIKPGRLEAFKAEVAAAGLSGDFLYSDQGFSALEGPIARLSETADTLFTLSLAVWGVLLIVLLILALRERHELGLLLSVGVRRKNAAWRLVFGWLAVLLPALLIGGVLASVSFSAFNEAVLGNLLTESEFSTRFSVGMTANPTATTAAELFATLPAGQAPLAEIWLAALLQLFAYFYILLALFALLARKKPQTLLRKKE